MQYFKFRILLVVVISIFFADKNFAQYLMNGAMYDSILGDPGVPLHWGVCDTNISTPELFIEYVKLDSSYYSLDSTSYVTLRIRGSGTHEHLFTKLITPLEKGNCYNFTAYFRHLNYGSNSGNRTPEVRFELWAGTDSCLDLEDVNNFELLYSSDTVSATEWKQYDYHFEVKNNNYDYLYIRPQWDDRVQSGYYTGVVQMDNLDLQLTGSSNLPVIDPLTYYFRNDRLLQFTAVNGEVHNWFPTSVVHDYTKQTVFLTSYIDTLSVTVFNQNVCPVTTKYHIEYNCDTIYENRQEIKQNIYLKDETPVIFDPSYGISHKWNPKDYLNDSTSQSPDVLEDLLEFITDTIVFVDSIKDSYGCTFADKFNVIKNCDSIWQRPYEIEIYIYYKGPNITMEASNGVSWQWEPSPYFDDVNIQSQIFTGYNNNFADTISFTSDIEMKYGCYKRDIFNIIRNCDTIHPNKAPQLMLDTTIQFNDSVLLNPQGTYNNQPWSPAVGLSNPEVINPVARPNVNTTYLITFKDNSDCLKSEYYIVRVALNIPNVITPNNDFKNDEFIIRGIIPNSTMTIFDKFGNTIYRKSNYGMKEWWDGKNIDGKYVEPGNYWYVLQLPNTGDIIKGFIFVVY